MKRIAFALPLLLLACVARQPVQPDPVVTAKPAQPAAELATILPEGHRAGAAVEINGARIVAIVADDAPAETPYLVLHEAMQAGVCTVGETGADEDGNVSGDVNTLLVSNTGSKPIFLMAGDLVLGGQQDRVLAESLVVDPGVKDMRIPVFCVEQGRWGTQARDGEEGAKGLFFNTPKQGQVDMSVKARAISARDQGAVWQQVETANRALGVAATSGTFRATYDDEKSQERIEAAYKEATGLVGANVVGFAVVHDGEVAAMDVFDSSGLAGKLSEKLLRSYIITALADGYKLPLESRLARQTVSVNCEGASVSAVATHLSRALGVTIEVDEEVRGAVSLSLEDVDGVAAVRALEERGNLAAIVVENGLRLIPQAQVSSGVPAEDPPTYYGEPVDEEQSEGPTLAFSGERTQQRVRSVSFSSAPSEGEDVPPAEVAPNDRTRNMRENAGEALRYSCEDKTTGRRVQTSYMRR